MADSKSPQEEATMRVHSTGLGQTTLYADVEDIFYKDGALIVKIKSVAPVVWQIRCATSRKGMWTLMLKMLKLENILYLLGLKKSGWPEEF